MVRQVLGASSFLILFFISCSKKQEINELKNYNTLTVKLVEKEGKVYQGNDLFSGKLYTLQDKDTVYKAIYINGLKDGAEFVCYSTGEKKEIRNYKNERQEGVAKGWYSNGKPMFEYHFKNGDFHGKYIEWYENGIMYRNQNFKDGLESGVQQVWNVDGKIKVNYVIKDGRRFGLLGTKNCKNVTEELFK
jgi:antitoxin component YwqK of YwqJK toxin-antitoxin module